jgi:hypothetical protein
MAGAALEFLVGSLKSKSLGKGRMIKGSDFHPGTGRMAGQALDGEAEGNVVCLLGCFVVLPMASQAIGGRGAETPSRVIRMAALAADLQMGALEGESGGQVDLKAGYVPESRGCVAEAAVGG